ncbi:MAG: LamG domain-containing protein [Candidatus Poribacteria bacterium]|nr:LamG domain-containing protein [Candidatus Poribacteria bacterium]
MKSLFYSVGIALIFLGLTASNAANIALQLDGKTYIEVPDSESLNPKKALTIEAWMKMESNGGECLAKDWGGQRDYIFPELIDGTKIRFVLWPQTKILDAPGLELKKWQHHAGVWDGKEMRIYVDGKKVGAAAYSAKELNDSKASLYIGVGDSAQWACTGIIDEIRIW